MEEEQVYLKKLSAIPGIEISVNTNWLFLHSMSNNMNISDVIIRYLVVEEYYKNKTLDEKKTIEQLRNKISYDSIFNSGFPMLALYYQMQYKRADYIKHISSIDVSSAIYDFLDLIHKVDTEGFNDNYPLEINQDFCLLDGAHRLAIALYHKVPRIKVFFNDGLNFTPNYSIDWFKMMNMDLHVSIINENYKRILERNCKSYYILANKKIEMDKLDDYYFINEINKIPKKKKYKFINKVQFNDECKIYQLIPKHDYKAMEYPKYTEKINEPKIIDQCEDKLIEFCDSNNYVLAKEDGD